MTEDVKRIIARTIGHEGKFTDDPDDSGNWTSGHRGMGELNGTKFGISASSYPTLDIKNITEDDAYKIYERDYYLAAHIDLLADIKVRWKVFDIAVNCGRHSAAAMLQSAVDDPCIDGIIGNNTALIVNLLSPELVMDKIIEAQKTHYGKIILKDPVKKKYFRGWMERANDKGDGL